jgi:hypothetical protein
LYAAPAVDCSLTAGTVYTTPHPVNAMSIDAHATLVRNCIDSSFIIHPVRPLYLS